MSTSQVIANVLEDNELKGMLLDALKKADFNIANIYVKNRKMEKQQRDAMMTFLSQLLGESGVEVDSIPEDRPIIWVTHKGKNGATYVKLLDDYLIREKDNIELGYLKGRYGAILGIKE